MYDWIKYIQMQLFSSSCIVCGGPDPASHSLCGGCQKELPWVKQACRCCGQHLEAERSGLLCGRCLQAPPAYDRTIALFEHEEPIRTLMHALKFNHRLLVAQLLGNLLVERVLSLEDALPDLIIPVPLHYQRLKERGFNQSIEIARPIVKRLGIPMLREGVVRSKATEEQSHLGAKQRRQNVRGAFQLQSRLAEKKVVIVDDVMTTGSTVNELARVLKQAGVTEVQVWVCARASKVG